MFARIVWPALGAGCAAGLVLAVLQVFLLTPIILHAENFEVASTLEEVTVQPALLRLEEGGLPLLRVHAPAEHGTTWAPEDGWERAAYTTLSTVLMGVGFALLLVSAITLKGGAISPKIGLAWGACGYVVFALAPALGLPPELPGSAAADLVSRQIWWVGTAAATAAGLAAIFFVNSRLWLAAGIALIAVPHILGAPHPHEFASDVPAELQGHFVATSLVSAAVFWVVMGAVAGALLARQSRQTQG